MKTEKLARAMYDASLSDPLSDRADRYWPKVRGYWVARAERVKAALR